jgi:RNA polymerase sigma factor (TIGR02999 family)
MVGVITQVLSQVGAGNRQSPSQLLPLVYCELRQLATARLRSEKAGHTLQATALVHEAYLRLLKRAGAAEGKVWSSRAHFFAAAAEAMRRILIENARRKRRYKRGADHIRVAIDIASIPSPAPSFDMLEIADALTDLEAELPEHATVVKLRYFVGMTIAECAEALGVATPTVERRWRYARAWLAQRLHETS